MKIMCFALACVIAAQILPQNVSAHKVNLFAYVEAGRVYCESYFPDGKPVQGGKIQIYDSAANLLLEGITDEQGCCDFAAPLIGDLTIVLEASLGHKAVYKLRRSDLEVDK